jgi:hypothetical protein
VTSGLEFGVYQFIIHADFVPASLGRNESDTLDFRLDIFEKLVCQAYGPVGVVSNCAVDDGNLHQVVAPFVTIQKLYCFLHKQVNFLVWNDGFSFILQ